MLDAIERVITERDQLKARVAELEANREHIEVVSRPPPARCFTTRILVAVLVGGWCLGAGTMAAIQPTGAHAQQPDWLLRYPTIRPGQDPCARQNRAIVEEIERLRAGR
jgi:hypothetical protein